MHQRGVDADFCCNLSINQSAAYLASRESRVQEAEGRERESEKGEGEKERERERESEPPSNRRGPMREDG